jgi:ATP-dependent DNA helicase RecG
MNDKDLGNTLSQLMKLPSETEWVEFKSAQGGIDFDKLGRYFSALSNEANLKKQPFGWLVFGVTDNRPRQVCGTHYKENQNALNKLKYEIAQDTNHQLSFHDIYEFTVDNRRVLLFQIPAALNGVPTEWRGKVYGRDGESTSTLSLAKIDRIRAPLKTDWSAEICVNATISHLDSTALQFARAQYKEKSKGTNQKFVIEINEWDDITFLNKIKICVDGKITNAAILLLGKPESASLLSPAIAQITWDLKDERGTEKDYTHFGPPFLLAVNEVFSKVRNLTYRYLPNATLFPIEIKQYNDWVIREILHNCIAHQDYRLGGRINVVEETDSLLFTNLGGFIPGSVEAMIHKNAPPEIYRNPFLAQAMVNLNMIDTIGSGINRMFRIQKERFFPLPDFDLKEPGRVQVRLIGKILDEKYTRMLIENVDLDLDTVIALDKVQKKRPLSESEFNRLKDQKLIEGRRPNLFVSATIAAMTDDKATYIKHRAFDKKYYKDLVLSYLEKFHRAQRLKIETLLMTKLSDALDQKKKKNFIRNLLYEMSHKDKSIFASGPRKKAVWQLSK